MDLPLEKLRPFRSLTKAVLKRIFGRGRTFHRGRKFAREGYLSEMKITLGEGDAVVTCLCWASQTKDKQHKVFLVVDCTTFELLESRCRCTAGMGKCSHQCAVMHHLCAAGAFLRSFEDGVDDNLDREDGEDGTALSCTSQPRTWGVPKRRVEPEVPVEDVNFMKVPEEYEVAFVPLSSKSSNPPRNDLDNLYSVSQLERFRESLSQSGHQHVLLRYFQPGAPHSPDPVLEEEDNTDQSAHLTSRFDSRRPSHLQYPTCLRPLIEDINTTSGEPDEDQMKVWISQLADLLSLGEEERQSVCSATKNQSSLDLWYKESISRLTASNFGLICKRRLAYRQSLVDQLLYKDPPPPVTITPIRQGRSWGKQ